MDRARRRQRAVFGNECLEVQPLEQLHHVVEGAVARDAEIVELDGMRGAEHRRRLRLAAKALHQDAALVRCHRAHRLPLDELDRRRPGEQPVIGPPDLPHSAMADAFAQHVAAHLARLAHLPAEPGDDVGEERRQPGADVVGDGLQQDLAHRKRVSTERLPDQSSDRVHRRDQHRHGKGSPWRVGNDRRIDQDRDDEPRHPTGAHDSVEQSGYQVCDQIEREPEIEQESGTAGASAGVPIERQAKQDDDRGQHGIERLPLGHADHTVRRDETRRDEVHLDDADRPQHHADEAHDAETLHRLPQQVVGQPPPPEGSER